MVQLALSWPFAYDLAFLKEKKGKRLLPFHPLLVASFLFEYPKFSSASWSSFMKRQKAKPFAKTKGPG